MKKVIVANSLNAFVWPLSSGAVSAYEVVVCTAEIQATELARVIGGQPVEAHNFEEGFVFRHFKKGVLNPKAQSLGQSLGFDANHFTVFYAVQWSLNLSKDDRDILLRAWCEPAIETIFVGAMSSLIDQLASPRQSSHDDSFDLSSEPQRLGLDLSAEEVSACLQFKKQFTRAEWECLAQSWSEHCKHKIFSAQIFAPGFGNLKVQSLFKDFIKGPSLKLIAQDYKARALSVFDDNAGVLQIFDSQMQPTSMALALKMETHNSPSAISPRGGAATGLVGVHRDILGTGLGARPIANWNVLCFESSTHNQQRTSGALKASQVRQGVVQGIEEGGNQSGVPTVQGSVYFAPNFVAKPYVFAGSIGLLKTNQVHKKPQAGLTLFCVGNRTGKDGLRGAVMSSRELRANDLEGGAVQVASPFVQRRMTDFLMAAKDQGLVDCITDNGAGGLSSSVGEMASLTGGARIDLTGLRLKDSTIVSWEKLLSESQERMTVASSQVEAFTKLAGHFGVEIDELGQLNQTGFFEVFDGGRCLVQLPLKLLHDACPKLSLTTTDSFDQASARLLSAWDKLPVQAPHVAPDLLTILAHEDLASREDLVRHFDHEVQGRSLTKIYSGTEQKSPGDFSILDVPECGPRVAISLSHGGSPHIKNPTRQALMAFDQALRSITLSGAHLKSVGALDNFSWPDPLANSQHLSHLVRVCQSLDKACQKFSIPLISGKDSMKNTSQGVDCLPILVVSMAGSAVQVENSPVPAASRANEILYLLKPLDASFEDSAWSRILGRRFEALSVLSQANSLVRETEIQVDLLDQLKKRYESLSSLVREGCVRSAKGVSQGGWIMSLYKLLRGNSLGAQLEVDISESSLAEGLGGCVISVDPHLVQQVESALLPCGLVRLGVTTKNSEIRSGSLRLNLAELNKVYDSLGAKGFWQ